MSGSCLKLSRILHAGYLLEWDKDLIAFDPIFENPFSYNCYAFPQVQFDLEKIKTLKLSAVIISHYHEDHCSLDSLSLLDKQTPLYLFCVHAELFQILQDLGFQKVYSIKLNEVIQIGGFKIFPRSALDQDVDSLFQIQVGGWQILNVVDSWIDPETLDLLLKQGPWDLILWPFQTMREMEVLSPSRFPSSDRKLPEECLQQLKQLNPKRIVPSSCQFQMEDWSWYNKAFFPISYEIFEQEIKQILPQTQVMRMNPGVSKELTTTGIKNEKPLSWIQPIGNQDIDYQYDKNLQVPSQAQVAQKIAAISANQKQRVHDFCSLEIKERWQHLELSDEDYFYDNKIWLLKLYQETGDVLELYYQCHAGKISLAPKESIKDTEVSWLTEISISKLYAALECGESLTSIYIRINDCQFSSKIEEELREFDILIDPLLRCLYNGEFASYQKSQLKRIKSQVIFTKD
jgi:L-ascorbate metabolism protein UlaG (beta-lactamase superfamily)